MDGIGQPHYLSLSGHVAVNRTPRGLVGKLAEAAE